MHNTTAFSRFGGLHLSLKSKPILVLQHVSCEPPGVYEDVFTELGFDLHRVQLGDGEPLPDSLDYSAVVVMGGPMGANDDGQFEWLAAEKKLITRAVEQGIPYWGVCLGAQLLAAALGARVFPGKVPEVGMSQVALTADGREDPCVGGLPDSFAVFQWHSDTFELPAGATRLITSSQYANQAFCIGSAYGVQFHVEVTDSQAAEWAAIPEYRDSLEQLMGPGAVDRVLDDLRANLGSNSAIARTIFTQWLQTYVLQTAAASHPQN